MKVKEEYTNLKVPSWAVCALINEDDEGLTEEEIDQIDEFEKDYPGILSIDGEDQEPSFEHYPEFGLASDCYICTVTVFEE